MADKPDFSKIWASESPLTPYSFADADYLKGWSMVGDIPPDRRMFDALQRLNDEKLKWVSENAALNLRKPSTEYAVGDIAYSALLPSWAYIECTVGGTTSDGDLPVPSSVVVGATFTDGTVTWAIRKIENMGNYTKTVNSPMFNKRDIITTSGTYTAPVTGWYKITVKGGGGGGGGGYTQDSETKFLGGGGGGEGGTTITYERMTAEDAATVTIGAGGAGGAYNVNGTDGGNSSVTINGNTYTGTGGGGGGAGIVGNAAGGAGGSGTTYGASGGSGVTVAGSLRCAGGNGGGAGGGKSGRILVPTSGVDGAGGGGGSGDNNTTNAHGADGGDGYVWFEYFDPSLNP